jgi:hypothetical protein
MYCQWRQICFSQLRFQCWFSYDMLSGQQDRVQSSLQDAVEIGYIIANNYGHDTRYIHIDGEVSLGTKSYHWPLGSTKRNTYWGSAPQTPAQNAPIERAGRTIIEKTRTTCIECGMDEKYWSEFIRDATYKANGTPIQRLNWWTPIGFITGRRP